MNSFIQLNGENIETEHICCAFSDKKCSESYLKKKEWLKGEFDRGYVFYRLDERAKVFIEYGPAENAWLPVTAPGFLNINCFWVSGKYKGNGLGKELLRKAERDAREQGKSGLVSAVGKKKFHFMSDGNWFIRQGFEAVDETTTGFVLLAKIFADPRETPQFNPEAKHGTCPEKDGLVAYYSNRCPYSEYHVLSSLPETAEKRGIPVHTVKIDSLDKARTAPSPATIFSLFYNGKFLTTDLSVCLDSRFDKFWEKTGLQ